MPTYIYRREDGSTFEIQQRITEDPLNVCPDTGQAVKRVISGNAGLIFKGSGFYLTDYARDNGSQSADSSEKKGSDDSSNSSETTTDTASSTAKSSD